MSNTETFRKDVAETLQCIVAKVDAETEGFQKSVLVDKHLANAGLLMPNWPEEYGGRNFTAAKMSILEEERAIAGIPMAKSPSRFGVSLLGPALISHGTEYQKDRYMPRIRDVKEIWCQGFSEPGAGSDLAGVRTKLASRGNGFVLSGRKIWTTQAHHADYCMVLARSSSTAPRHENLTFVLVDMKAPGVEVHPIRMLTGDAEFNEVTFDETPIEEKDIVGQLHGGWDVANTVLKSERSYGMMSRFNSGIEEITTFLRELKRNRVCLTETESTRLSELLYQWQGLRAIATHIVRDSDLQLDIGLKPSIAKLHWSRLHQETVDFMLSAKTRRGLSDAVEFDKYLTSRAETIYAGTSEIQLEIISKSIVRKARASN